MIDQGTSSQDTIEISVKSKKPDDWSFIYFFLQNLHKARQEVTQLNESLEKINENCSKITGNLKSGGEYDGRKRWRTI